MGVVSVPDDNLEKLAGVLDSKESVELRPAAIKFIDIAGLIKGAAEGQGLGNQFLGNIRDTDVILHVLREFRDPNIEHVGEIDPVSDLEIVNTELILKDLETIERLLSEVKSQKLKVTPLRQGFAGQEGQRLIMLEKFMGGLNEGKSVRRLNLTSEEEKYANELRLLTVKPIIYVLNVDEDDLSEKSDHIDEFMQIILKLSDRKPLIACAKLEQDLPDLVKADREKYLSEMGITGERARIDIVDEIINTCYDLLGLIGFYTIKGGKIISAWSLKEGANALEAAEKIHTDLAKEFIKAEVIGVEEVLEIGSWKSAKEEGKVRLEGKEYVIRDEDVIEIKV